MLPGGVLVDEWLDHRRSVGGVSSEHTEAAYRRDLAQWAWRTAEILGKPDVEGAEADRAGPAGPGELGTPGPPRSHLRRRRGGAGGDRSGRLRADDEGPLSPEVLEAIDGYMQDRATRLGPSKRGDPLLVTAKGRPLSRAALNWHIERWCARAGVVRPAGEVAHAFRHTYAKGLVARGVALPVVQQLLGHKDLKTTSVYLRMTAVEVAEGAAAAVRDHLGAVPAPPPRGNAGPSARPRTNTST